MRYLAWSRQFVAYCDGNIAASIEIPISQATTT
jgi:hypothetical protein